MDKNNMKILMERDYSSHIYERRDAHERLKKDMEAIEDIFRHRCQKIKLDSKADPALAGTQAENDWIKLLEEWLPTFKFKKNCRISLKNGQDSKEVDIAILKPETPNTVVSGAFIPQEYVVAVFEVKLTLNRSHFQKIITQCSHIKSSLGDETGNLYCELNSQIIYGILAHSCDLKSNEKVKIIREEFDKYSTNLESPKLLPDIVLIADSLSCEVTKTVSPNNIDVSLKYSSNAGVFGNKHPASNFIGFFFYCLFFRLKKQGNNIEVSIFEYFELPEIISLGFINNVWTLDIFSQVVIKEIEAGALGRANTSESEWFWIQ